MRGMTSARARRLRQTTRKAQPHRCWTNLPSTCVRIGVDTKDAELAAIKRYPWVQVEFVRFQVNLRSDRSEKPQKLGTLKEVNLFLNNRARHGAISQLAHCKSRRKNRQKSQLNEFRTLKGSIERVFTPGRPGAHQA